MAMNNTVPIAIAVIGIAGGAWYFVMKGKDKTPVGLTVTKALEMNAIPIGLTTEGDTLTAGAVEGTWRADEDSLSVASESAEKPLLVVYEDGTPIDAQIITMSEFQEPNGEDYEENEEGEAKRLEEYNIMMEKWREFAKDAGATEESIESLYQTEEPVKSQAAESSYGTMLSLQY